MLSIDLFKEIDNLIPKELALKEDKIGYFGLNHKNTEISKIKIMLDILPEDDENSQKEELIITKNPPTFTPKTPTYTINTNWDVITGGSSDTLAKILNLKIEDAFDKKTGIGRICPYYKTLKHLLLNITDIIDEKHIKIANIGNSERKIKKIAIIPGSALNNKKYIKLAKERAVDVLISGDLTHNSIILAKKFDITLIDITNYYSQIPGLFALAEIISTIGIPIEVIDKGLQFDYTY